LVTIHRRTMRAKCIAESSRAPNDLKGFIISTRTGATRHGVATMKARLRREPESYIMERSIITGMPNGR